MGSHKLWIARNFPTGCANGCIISNGLATMGIALPGTIAASLVAPGRQIVAAMGDGGFLMSSQELRTAKRVGARFTCVVFDDNDYGLISEGVLRRAIGGTELAVIEVPVDPRVNVELVEKLDHFWKERGSSSP